MHSLRILTAGFLVGMLVGVRSGWGEEPASLQNVLKQVIEVVTGAPSGAPSTKDTTPATHRQTRTIKVTKGSNTFLTFCLDQNGDILAGCSDPKNEIRRITPDGSVARTIALEFKPEAITVDKTGLIYAGGDGKLVVLKQDGAVVSKVEAPHMRYLRENADKVRKEFEEQMKLQTKAYEQRIEQLKQQIDTLNKQIERERADNERAKAKESTDEKSDDTRPRVARRPTFRNGPEQQRKSLEAQLKAYEQIVQRRGSTDAQFEATMSYKRRISSIAVHEQDVFIANTAAVGYGFEVWRMNRSLTGGERIVKDLRGCCGQMHVDVNENGVYVAENSRHRVARFDRDGKLTKEWGKRGETVRDFSSCCNPANLAFAANGDVYTSESTTGRIKRFDKTGALLDFVGTVDLVPGCKNVSIAVTPTGDRVYMMDLTRGHICVMERKPTGELTQAAPTDAALAKETRP